MPANKTTGEEAAPALPRVRRGNAEDAQRMRSTMAEAALALFSEGGLGAVSMRALSARLNISTMTPYHYFESKAELLSELWQHVLKEVYATVSRAVDEQAGARARLAAYAEAFLHYYETHPDQYRLVYMTQHGEHEAQSGGLERASVFLELRDLLRRLMSELAIELGADLRHVKIAEDLLVITLFGYLQAALLNRRYPWSRRELLRPACVAQLLLSAERCLADGPGAGPPA
jgi:AcrR family transcriptional regulator